MSDNRLVAKIETYLDTVSLDQCIDAFAVPGADTLIDLVHPVTGLSVINGHSLDQIRERYPSAEIVNVESFLSEKAARQDACVEWIVVTEEYANEMLCSLPPAAMGNQGFLVGEPYDHHATTGQPRFQAIRRMDGAVYRSSRPMTRAEFTALT